MERQRIRISSIILTVFWVFATIVLLTRATHAITYTYDNLNRLTKAEYKSGLIIEYEYDAGGNILSVRTSEPDRALSVTPAFQAVPAESGVTTFDIANTGADPMNWTATVDENDIWLTITGSNSGTDDGTITVRYEANPDDARIGRITIRATAAKGSPQTVEVRQQSVDTDGDGVADDEDIFPDDPNEWSDNDEDETGDNADPDDDNDQMPDDWEAKYDELDLFVDDSSEDTDKDGHSNLAEYLAGTDPTDADSFPIPGVFIVGDFGVISLDWLYDGGAYRGELGIFSLEGMDLSVPDLTAFIEEAVNRVLSGVNGYLVLSDPTHKARFSGTLGGEPTDWNEGELLGLREFNMEPETRFALMLVPNSTFAKLAANPETTDKNTRPLFSFASPDADYGMHAGQVADINGMGKAFVFEDMEFTNSDRDYNDLIVQILGAKSEVPTIDDMLAFTPASGKRSRRDSGGWLDWRTDTELGRKIISHVEATPGNDDMSVSLSLDAAADLMVYASDESSTGKDGGEISGSSVRFADDGTQTVSLPKSDGDADYRIVLRGLEDEAASVTVRRHLGLSELSADTTAVRSVAHQVISADISVSSSDSGMIVSIGEMCVPAGPDGTPLHRDMNGDGKMDDEDIEMVSSRWNTCEGDPGYDLFFDFDEDGCITVLDIMSVSGSM